MHSHFEQIELWFMSLDVFTVLLSMALAIFVAVGYFVVTELLNYNLTNLVPYSIKQARERHDRLKDRVASARANLSPEFAYDWGDKLLNAATLCLDDADRKVARAPSHIKSYKVAWKDVKLAVSQLGAVEALFTYIPNEG
jgi:hypothetical protein